MLKSLRVPERLFQLAGWAVSVVFAGFLIGLGGQLVGELPGVDQRLTLEQFMDPVRSRRVAIARDSLVRLQRDLSAAQDRARLSLTASSNAYRSRNESFNNWIATRVATTDPKQDPEVLRRTQELDELKSGERAAQTEVERLDESKLRVSQAIETLGDLLLLALLALADLLLGWVVGPDALSPLDDGDVEDLRSDRLRAARSHELAPRRSWRDLLRRS